MKLMIHSLTNICLLFSTPMWAKAAPTSNQEELQKRTIEVVRRSKDHFNRVEKTLFQNFKAVERETMGQLEGRWSDIEKVPIYGKKTDGTTVLGGAATGASIGFSLGGLISLPFMYTAAPVLAVPSLLGALFGGAWGSINKPQPAPIIGYETVEKPKGSLKGDWYQINRSPNVFSTIIINDKTSRLIRLNDTLSTVSENNCTQKVISKLNEIQSAYFVQTESQFMNFVRQVEDVEADVEELNNIAIEWLDQNEVTKYEALKKTAQEMEGLNPELGGLRNIKLLIDVISFDLGSLANDACKPTTEATEEYLTHHTLTFVNYMNLLSRRSVTNYPSRK